MNKKLFILFLAMLMFTLSACHTVKGVGKDVEGAGEWIQKKAN